MPPDKKKIKRLIFQKLAFVMTSADDMPRRYIIHTMARDGVSKLPYQVASPLSCVITGGPAPILRLVNEVKPEKG
jgi:hypothetical protein